MCVCFVLKILNHLIAVFILGLHRIFFSLLFLFSWEIYIKFKKKHVYVVHWMNNNYNCALLRAVRIALRPIKFFLSI